MDNTANCTPFPALARRLQYAEDKEHGNEKVENINVNISTKLREDK